MAASVLRRGAARRLRPGRSGSRPAAARPRVLLTLADRPEPADGGKRMRAAATLRGLAGLDVDLDVVVLFAGPPLHEALPPGVRVASLLQLDLPPRGVVPALLGAARRGLPWQIAVLPWSRVRAALRPLRGVPYDLVWYGATDHAVQLGGAVTARRTVVDMDDVETAKLRAFLALPGGVSATSRLDRLQRRVELPLWARLERRMARRADTLVVCSELDRSRVGGSGSVAVVPNGYPEASPSAPGRAPDPVPTLLLVGTYHYPPNVDAARYAAREVLPLVRELVPQARLRLVGRGGETLLRDLAGLPGVDVVGSVPDVAPELARARAALVPVRYGGGTRVKVLEAFASGLPVVSTRLGCEGLDVVPDRDLLVADGAAGLAQECARVLLDDRLAGALAAAALRVHREGYRTQVCTAAVAQVARAQLEGLS